MLLYLPVILFESLSCASIGILQGARGWRPPRFIWGLHLDAQEPPGELEADIALAVEPRRVAARGYLEDALEKALYRDLSSKWPFRR
jgi:hypothetical protein